MSNKANLLNHQHRDWILNERSRIIHAQNKVILPRLPPEEAIEQHRPGRSLRKRDTDPLALPLNESSLRALGRSRQKAESLVDTSRTLQSETDSRLENREIREEKTEIIKEMKGWIRTVQNATREGNTLQEGILGRLENALYKWCLFIQQTFSHYQKIEKNVASTPTPHSSSLKYKNPEDTPRTPGQCQDMLASFKEQRELYEKEIRRLSLRVQESEKQLEANRVNNIQSIQRVAEVEKLFKEWSGKAKRDITKQREQTKLVDALLEKNQQFLQELKRTLVEGKQTSSFVEKIDQELRIITQFKSKRQDDDEQRAKGSYL